MPLYCRLSVAEFNVGDFGPEQIARSIKDFPVSAVIDQLSEALYAQVLEPADRREIKCFSSNSLHIYSSGPNRVPKGN